MGRLCPWDSDPQERDERPDSSPASAGDSMLERIGCEPCRGFVRGGLRKEGFHTQVRGTMFFGTGASTPGLSRECDITFFLC